jgi:nucleoside 2-deoxyribosyltransferase
MNYLRGKKVYLSGPIHFANDCGVAWRDLITPRLRELGLEVLDPCKKVVNGAIDLSEVGKNKDKFQEMIMQEDWSRVKKEFWPIVRADLRAVDHCDFVICDYDPLIPMVGTIHELVVATFEKKVILLKYDKDQLKNFNPWIAALIKEHHFFDEWDKMMEHLKKVDAGQFDTSLWVI